MNTLSVKKLADELKVSKQAIHKRIKQLPSNLKPELVKGAYELSVETADYIRSEVQSTTDNRQPINHQPVNDDQSIVKEYTCINHTNSNKSEPDTESKDTSPSADNQPIDGEVDAFRLLAKQKDNEINRLANELVEKNNQIHKLQSLLDQQQQLALQMQLRNNKLDLQLEEAKTEEISDSKPTKKKWWQFFG